ncbi:hypothetical protein QTP88_014860 [Uroleucon formosanum]
MVGELGISEYSKSVCFFSFQGIRELSYEELNNTLVEVDAILNTVSPIPADRNLDATLDYNIIKNKLKKILIDVFDLLNSLPKVDANNAVASTSVASRYVKSKEEEEKIQCYRKYKNRYNYIEKLKHKLPPLKVSGKVVSIQDGVNGTGQNNANSLVRNNVNSTEQNDANSTAQNNANSTVQNDVNSIVQNDLNDNTQNNINDTAQINLNEKKYTLNDIIQNEHVYEMFKSRLKNSPYDDSLIKKNVSSSKVLTLKLANGETIAKPMSYVAPLIMLKKCDDLYPIPLQNKEPMDIHLPSTSKQTNDSNITNSSKKNNRKKKGANKTKDIKNSFKTNVKTFTRKRRSTIKNSKYETSKNKKKLKQFNIY